jgi:ATP-dependent protease ClpP protease subunit
MSYRALTADSHRELTADWSTSIFLHGTFDDKMYLSVSQQILRYRQAGVAAITVGIDSPGGMLSVMDSILSLFGSNIQELNRARCVSVVTREASSAAALFLSLSDYAVADRDAVLLYHSVRIRSADITPDQAKRHARNLSMTNFRMAARLAGPMLARLSWAYISVSLKDAQSEPEYERLLEVSGLDAESLSHTATNSETGDDTTKGLNIIAYLAAIHPFLTYDAKQLVENALERMKVVIEIDNSMPKTLREGTDIRNRQSRDLDIYRAILAYIAGTSKRYERASDIIERANLHFQMWGKRDNNPSETVERRFESKAVDECWSRDAKRRAGTKSKYQTKTFWLFCLVFCQALLDNENQVSGLDAHFLGLVDEVCLRGGETLTSDAITRIYPPREILAENEEHQSDADDEDGDILE